MLLGIHQRLGSSFTYGTLTHSGTVSQRLQLKEPPTLRAGRPEKMHPTTPHTQRLPSLTRMRFSLFPVRSPLLPESLLFSLPAGTEMFHFSASPPTVLYIQTAATRHNSLGFPIRTPSDHSSFGSSPRLIAAYYVLHRLLVPRHPPYATITWPLQITRCSRTLFTSQNTNHEHPYLTPDNREFRAVVHRKQPEPEKGSGLLPQTPNSAPPGPSRNPRVKSDSTTAIPDHPEGSPGPLSSPTSNRKRRPEKDSLERRCSSRTFRYGYLVTT